MSFSKHIDIPLTSPPSTSEEEEEEDDGCGNGLTKCCDGQCLHEHMCPKCDDDDKEDEDDDEDDDEGSTEPPTENAGIY